MGAETERREGEKAEMTEFTFLLPCLNEATSLAFCIGEIKDAIARLGLDAEILVADNGSEDGSQKIAMENGARVVDVPERGYGAALSGGIRAAVGRYVLMGDADGSYDFSRPDVFVEQLRAGAALVVGNRFRGGIEKGAMPFSHRLGVPALSALARWRFGAPVWDFHCGLRGVNREACLSLELRCPGMEFATEMIAAAAKQGQRICDVPTVLRCDRRGRRGHLRTVRDGLRHLRFILRGYG